MGNVPNNVVVKLVAGEVSFVYFEYIVQAEGIVSTFTVCFASKLG